MEIPKLTKMINGVEYRYCGNHPDPAKASRHMQLSVSRIDNERRWLKDAILLEPMSTDFYTVERLEKMDLISVWKPPRDFESRGER